MRGLRSFMIVVAMSFLASLAFAFGTIPGGQRALDSDGPYIIALEVGSLGIARDGPLETNLVIAQLDASFVAELRSVSDLTLTGADAHSGPVAVAVLIEVSPAGATDKEPADITAELTVASLVGYIRTDSGRLDSPGVAVRCWNHISQYGNRQIMKRPGSAFTINKNGSRVWLTKHARYLADSSIRVRAVILGFA